MMRALVIGGRGYYGARVVEALRAIEGLEVTVASRSAGPEARVDLGDSGTFEAMLAYDLIINSSDSVGAPPEAAARFCLERGRIWLDMGADAGAVDALLALDGVADGQGAIIVGVGIFPGLSTALAREVVGEGASSVTLGVRLSPLSGAGRANCALMTRMLDTPAVWFEGCQRREGAAVGPAVSLPYLRAGDRPSARVGLPDAALIARATGVPNVSTHMALSPGLLRYNFMIIVALLGLLGPLKPLALWLTEQSLVLMRALLLRGVTTRVELVAVADADTPTARVAQLTFDDGQIGTALGVAATVRALLATPTPPRGVLTAAEVTPWPTITETLRGVAAIEAEGAR